MTPPVTTICKDSASRASFKGTSIILNFFFAAVQTVVFVYVLYHTCCRNKTKISRKLSVLLQLYHLFVLLHLISCAIPPIDSMVQTTDLSTLLSCYSDIYLSVHSCAYYFTFLMFWYARLIIVFDGSVYEMTPFQNRLFYSTATVVVIIILIMLFYALIESIVATDKNDVFCLERLDILDFYPSASIHINKSGVFYDCVASSTANFYTIIFAAVIIPLTNILIAGLYAYKMYGLFGAMARNRKRSLEARIMSRTASSMLSAASKPQCIVEEVEKNPSGQSDQSDQSRQSKLDNLSQTMRQLSNGEKKQIYRTGIIAMFSSLGTLLTMVLYVADRNFAVLFFLDGVLNGVLMISVFQFGEWIFELLCVKVCCNYAACRYCGRLVLNFIDGDDRQTYKDSIDLVTTPK